MFDSVPLLLILLYFSQRVQDTKDRCWNTSPSIREWLFKKRRQKKCWCRLTCGKKLLANLSFIHSAATYSSIAPSLPVVLFLVRNILHVTAECHITRSNQKEVSVAPSKVVSDGWHPREWPTNSIHTFSMFAPIQCTKSYFFSQIRPFTVKKISSFTFPAILSRRRLMKWVPGSMHRVAMTRYTPVLLIVVRSLRVSRSILSIPCTSLTAAVEAEASASPSLAHPGCPTNAGRSLASHVYLVWFWWQLVLQYWSTTGIGVLGVCSLRVHDM